MSATPTLAQCLQPRLGSKPKRVPPLGTGHQQLPTGIIPGNCNIKLLPHNDLDQLLIFAPM